MAQNPLITFIELLAVVLVFFIGALILTAFFNLMPINPLTGAVKMIYLSVFSFFDASFFYILIFVLIIDIIVAYFKPSLLKAMENIIFLLSFGFIFISIKGLFLKAVSTLSFNAIMPMTSATLSSNYTTILIFFMLVVASVLNFRKPENEETTRNSEDNE